MKGTADGDSSRAHFSDPFGVAVAPDGSILVADGVQADRIRRIAPDGRVSTVAGSAPGFIDGRGETARFSTPSGIAVDAAGAIYVADTGNNVIRRIAPDGLVSTFAGDGTPGNRDDAARKAQFNGPIGVAVDRTGRVIVADTYNDRIRVIERDGAVRTLAGSGEPGNADGVGTRASFHTPCGVAVDSHGNVYVADTGNGVVRTIDPGGTVTTAAWSLSAGVFRPTAIAIGPDDEVYITEERGRIVAASANGSTRTVAGSLSGFRDGNGEDARFRAPSGVAVAGPGRLVVADTGNALIRLVAAPSRIEFRPPPPPGIHPRFDEIDFGLQPLLWPVAPFEGPHEVAGTIGEIRGGQSGGRFHAGIDVRVDEGLEVHAIRDGVIANPIASDAFGTLNEWLRIGPITYIHIRAGRTHRHETFEDPRWVATRDDERRKLTGIRVKRGARFAAGETIGTVNPFNHVHLNVGWPGEELNPLQFHLVQFEDRVPPTIARGGVHLYDEAHQLLAQRTRGRVVVSGRVEIVVDAWDQADGNRPERRLGLYDLGYQVLNRDGSPAVGFDAIRHTMRFDRLSQEPGTAALVYAPGSGIPFYNRRRTQFLYIVTNTLREGVATQGFWDTTQLPPGEYILRVWVADIRGNVATMNRDVPVEVVKPDAATASPTPHSSATGS